MCNSNLTLYCISSDEHEIEEFLSSPVYKSFTAKYGEFHIEISQYGYRLAIMSFNYYDFHTEKLWDYYTEERESLLLLFNETRQSALRFLYVFKISGINVKKDSVPGIGLERDAISLCCELKASIVVEIHSIPVKPYRDSDRPDSGAYYYIFSEDKQLDFSEITRIAGVEPTSIHKKGEIIYTRPAKENDWCLEYSYDKTYPEIPINHMMGQIKNPFELGQYCYRKGLDSKIDLTYYGIFSPHITFTIEARFLLLCHKLQVKWIDVDIG